MKDIMAAMAIWTGAIVGLLKIIDFLLTEYQKVLLKKKTENLWVWLASRDFKKYSSFLVKRKFHLASIVIASFFYFIPFVLFPMIDKEAEFLPMASGSSLVSLAENIGYGKSTLIKIFDIFILFISAFLIYRYALPKTFSWLSKELSYGKFYLRLFLINSITFTATSIVAVLGLGISISYALGESVNISLFSTILCTYSLFVIPIGILTNIYSILFIFSSIWILAITPIIKASFKTLQFIVFRVAENKNGVVVSISGVLIGIGIIIKVIIYCI